MEAGTNSNRIHPLVATAAVAVTLVSLTGIAAMTGLLPNSQSANSPAAAINATTEAAGVAGAREEAKEAVAEKAVRKSGTSDQKTVRTAAGETADKPVNPIHHKAVATAPKSEDSEAREVREVRVADRPDYTQRVPHAAQATFCDTCGRVESVRAIQKAAEASGVGIAAGAVIGGLLGNQVGGGNGRALATVAGAVGGGYAGNEVEKRTRSTTTYEVQVRMEDGRMRTIPQSSSNGWQTGDRVKIVNGALVSNS